MTTYFFSNEMGPRPECIHCGSEFPAHQGPLFECPSRDNTPWPPLSGLLTGATAANPKYFDTLPLASTTQVGGSHYTSMKIQPFEYITANNLGFVEGSVIKYVSRWRNKNGVEDLKKARHFLDMLIESETAK
jgi:hypothetical protein